MGMSTKISDNFQRGSNNFRNFSENFQNIFVGLCILCREMWPLFIINVKIIKEVPTKSKCLPSFCCIPRPQSIVVHIASMATTRMSLSHSKHLQCYLKIRYIHGALRSLYATMHNAAIQKTTFFEYIHTFVCMYVST